MWLAQQNIADKYNAIVTRCLHDEYYYNRFKRIRDYTEIVSQHPPYGLIYYEKICNDAPRELYLKLPEISKCDQIGNPYVDQYEHELGNLVISACNLRYVYSVIELERYFKFSKNDINIVEIGVGFGGLCFAINQWLTVNTYCLIDLENVQQLASKCLEQLGNTNHTTEVPERIDLLISEYCLSEFSDSLIDSYYNDCVIKAENIYLRFNLHEEQRKLAFLQKLGNDFDYIVYDEWPITQWPNYVIVGTRKNK